MKYTDKKVAMLVACGLGVYNNLCDAGKSIMPKKTFAPSEDSRLYEDGYKKYLSMYDKFKNLF